MSDVPDYPDETPIPLELNTELARELDRDDLRTATIRTALPAGWAVALVAAITYLTDWAITVEDLLPWAPVAAVAYAAFYRVLRVIEKVAPNWLRYIFFGSTSEPMY